MQEVVSRLTEALKNKSPLAYCRLVETRGSTPQKAGATMLVFPQGMQAGTLGGGCVEAEVKKRPLLALRDHRPTIERFQLDHDYGWDDGLICGGRMLVLIDPIHDTASRRYYEQWARLARENVGWTEAVAFDPSACRLDCPASFLLDQDNHMIASLHHGGPGLPETVSDTIQALSVHSQPHALRGISVLPVPRRCRLVIVGGGHVGLAVAKLAVDLDFDVWVIDDREEFVSADRFPLAERRICGDMEQVLKDLETTPETYCLIVTRGHQHDQRALYHLAACQACYVGMIGSKRKIKLIFENLLQEGVAAEALRRVFAPLGIDIGSQTVPEIAISICAELIAHRNRGGLIPGRSASPTISGIWETGDEELRDCSRRGA